MKMGRERGVLRWDIHHTLLTEQIATAEKALSAVRPGRNMNVEQASERQQVLAQELATLRSQLAALGPSPRAKMG